MPPPWRRMATWSNSWNPPTDMEQEPRPQVNLFVLSGLHCAACAGRVESLVRRMDGVSQVDVNLVSCRMRVDHDAAAVSAEAIAAAVKKAGYGAEPLKDDAAAPVHDTGAGQLFRFIMSALFLVALLYVRHGWGREGTALYELVLLAPVLALNGGYFVRGAKAALHLAPNMDTLVALGAGAAVAYSLADVFWLHTGSGHAECAAMVLTIVTFGKWLEARVTGHAGDALDSLRRLLPQQATLLQQDGTQQEIPARQVMPGDSLLVRPGARVPADATVVEGVSEIDESAFTGESLPVEKSPGSKVFAGTINGSNALTVKADAAPADSGLSGLLHMLDDAAAVKPPISRTADRVASVLVPVVILLACVAGGVWYWLGMTPAFALGRAISVLVVSCPCALGLATPVAVMVATGRAARAGVVFRHGEDLENLGKCTIAVLDKTGTLTSGKPSVCKVEPAAPGMTEQGLLELAAALESRSNHPYARAIFLAAPDTPVRATGFSHTPGRGVQASVDGVPCAAGNALFMQELGVDTSSVNTLAVPTVAAPLYIARGGTLAGMVAVADSLRPGSSEAVNSLLNLGMGVMMVTGDNRRTAEAMALQAGIDNFRAEQRPQDKVELVKQLRAAGYRVLMVGDGINDAPALAAADVSMAMGMGTDVAQNSAGIILTRSNLQDASRAISQSRDAVHIIKRNLLWAYLYNLVAIPVAGGALFPLMDSVVAPGACAAAMCASSLFVVLSSLRLRRSALG